MNKISSTERLMLSCVAVSLVAAVTLADSPTVLLVPARQSVVAFCADVVSIKPETIMVAYDMSKKTATPALSLWDPRARDWKRIGLDEYRMGTAFVQVPKKVILIGNDPVMTEGLRAASAGMGAITLVERMDAMNLANGIDGVVKFSPSHWKYLARRHGIELKDMNWERRRYGKYGKPGEEIAEPTVRGGEQPTLEPFPAPRAPETGKAGGTNVKMPQTAEVGTTPVVPPVTASRKKVNPADK